MKFDIVIHEMDEYDGDCRGLEITSVRLSRDELHSLREACSTRTLTYAGKIIQEVLDDYDE